MPAERALPDKINTSYIDLFSLIYYLYFLTDSCTWKKFQ